MNSMFLAKRSDSDFDANGHLDPCCNWLANDGQLQWCNISGSITWIGRNSDLYPMKECLFALM